MDTNIIHQEILLVADTTFSQKQLSEKDGNESQNLTEHEKLQKACWDGLLDELLPEVITNKKLHIWQIWDGENSLDIELSQYPLKEKHFSINPYYVISRIENN